MSINILIPQPLTIADPVLEIADALSSRTYAPSARLPLGNQQDPLDELFFIVLTTMTQYGPEKAFHDLKREFPDWQGLLDEDGEARVRKRIARCGLVDQKAPQIIAIAERLQQDFGRVSLDWLFSLSDADAERYLLSLPRVGKKVARCVMMYSLGRQVLPVDAHVLRTCKRIGLLPEHTSWAKAHDELNDLVPSALRYGLHVALVVHGREVCQSKRPKCAECVLRSRGVCSFAAAHAASLSTFHTADASQASRYKD